MARQKAAQDRYMVSVYDDLDAPGSLRFTFVPRGLQQPRVPGEPAKAIPQYIVSIQGHGDGTALTWINPPLKDSTKEELVEIALARVTARQEWLAKLRRLVEEVKQWAESLGWATKAVEKKMEDPEIGNYKGPALLLQEEVVRLFLEPVSRAAPGAEGVVDLYRMPAYDDIASLYYYSGKWNAHYLFPGTPTVGNIREAEAKPLTKETLRAILDEMKKDAG